MDHDRTAPGASQDRLMSRFQVQTTTAPKSIDEKTRSIEVIGATETPSQVWDPQRFEIVTETLLMSGCELPPERQVPLTIEHYRDAQAVIGSFTDMHIEGDQLVGRAVFSSAPDVEPFWIKTREGHLRRFSVTYPSDTRESVWIAEGQTGVVAGKTYTGPILVTTRWQPKSLGLVLYAADEHATARGAASGAAPLAGEPSVKPETTQGGRNMDKRLRAFLERHGLAPTATEDEALAYLEIIGDALGRSGNGAVPPAAAAAATADQARSQADLERERAELVRAERERVAEIHALCRRFGMVEMADKLIEDGTSVDAARKAVLEKLDLEKIQTPSHRPATIVADAWDKFRSAAEDAILIRSGQKVQTPAPGAMDLAGYSLYELARHSLIVSNKPAGGSKLEMVGRALTTSDFPLLLANVANKSLFAGWESAQETWSEWCAVGSVSDFKTHHLPRISETSDLDEIPENAEYSYGSRTEADETFKIATYGKLLAISRQAIINDDLAALTDIPMAHGEAAARKVGDLPYAVLTANAAMGDGYALFSSQHHNYVASGSGAAPGIATIAAGILAMGTQKDLAGKRRLNIRPVYFIGPKALEGVAEVFFRTDRYSDSNTVATDSSMASTRVNPYSGTVFTRIYDARLDDDDTATWYLAASKGRTVKVFFLGGQQRPYMETRQGWTVDGVEYKVRIDAGAKAVDWRGLYCNEGK